MCFCHATERERERRERERGRERERERERADSSDDAPLRFFMEYMWAHVRSDGPDLRCFDSHVSHLKC